ncbi:MAG: glucose-6-phosphate isomerase [Methylobacteriaceae bacterium]|jgi:glucose-6-phosphate isomerase|nr:glucose-6-phosphate isomerase [Methylobacteriaceae bacterium]
MALQQNIEYVSETKVGMGGVSQAALEQALADVEKVLPRLREDEATGRLPLLKLPRDSKDLLGMSEASARLRKDATDVVFLGTGGSSLGGQTLAQLKDYNVPGLGRFVENPRIHFLDNLDPVTFDGFLKKVPLKTSRFVAISKSGGTGETLMQSIAILSAFAEKEPDLNIADHFLGLSEPRKPGGKNALRDLLEPYGVKFLEHQTGVGGRYSCITNVGLLPAAVVGLDAGKVREGATVALLPALEEKDVNLIPAAVGASIHIAAMREGKNVNVVMAYGDRFERFTRWWVQLWAESLGKDGKGTSPVAAIGPVDQHSQQQLYLGGPRDKLFTIVTVGTAGKGPVMDKALSERAHEPGFAGKTIGDFVAAQGRAAPDTLARNGCATRRIHLETLDELSLGELLMHFMLETILTGYTMGVDPFDQPAVEEAKILAKKYLAEG